MKDVFFALCVCLVVVGCGNNDSGNNDKSHTEVKNKAVPTFVQLERSQTQSTSSERASLNDDRFHSDKENKASQIYLPTNVQQELDRLKTEEPSFRLYVTHSDMPYEVLNKAKPQAKLKTQSTEETYLPKDVQQELYEWKAQEEIQARAKDRIRAEDEEVRRSLNRSPDQQRADQPDNHSPINVQLDKQMSNPYIRERTTKKNADGKLEVEEYLMELAPPPATHLEKFLYSPEREI
ncbi:hypothetical protein FACS1894126_3220 [Alphaproteobacteria bacterium]|nr:hypothetical protein FACS1894126_3220 [Alphaproteobacteria bacterium]